MKKTIYSLGIDGLPLGNFAAIRTDETIEHKFQISEKSPISCLILRTQTAIKMAEKYMSYKPEKIVLACIDDGSDGESLKLLHNEYEVEVDVGYQKYINEYLAITSDQNISDDKLSELRAISATIEIIQKSSSY